MGGSVWGKREWVQVGFGKGVGVRWVGGKGLGDDDLGLGRGLGERENSVCGIETNVKLLHRIVFVTRVKIKTDPASV